MLHSETMARAVHADRLRDLDRIARERRLLVPPDVSEAIRLGTPGSRRASAPPRQPGCGDSAGVPAQVRPATASATSG